MRGETAMSAERIDRQDVLKRFGIRHVLTDVFFHGDYRYAKLEEAVAQAMRDQEPAKGA
jgi:hypothetical protein